jgi:transmembrane sensor
MAARLYPRWNWLSPPATVVATLCLVWWVDPSIVQNWRADIVTGEQFVSTFTLPDGSTAHLGADTALSLDFNDGRRRVRLLRGEAYFEVRHGLPGTFTVAVNADEVRDIGTKFNVDLDTDQTEITVSEGAVEVLGSNDTSPIVLRAGDQVAIAGGRTSSLRSTDADLALSWLTGRLVVQGVRVDDLVRELQRHTSSRIIVRGSLADRQISGTFPLTDVDASLATIASAVDGSVTHVTPLMTVLY